jgi:hypothetical protein
MSEGARSMLTILWDEGGCGECGIPGRDGGGDVGLVGEVCVCGKGQVRSDTSIRARWILVLLQNNLLSKLLQCKNTE